MSRLKDFEDNLQFLIDKSRKPLIWLETFDYSYVVDTLQNKLKEQMIVWDTALTNYFSLNYDLSNFHSGLGTFIPYFSEGKVDFSDYTDQDDEEEEVFDLEDKILYLKERLLIAKVRESMFEEMADETDDRLVAHLQKFVYDNNKRATKEKKTILLVSTYHFDVNGLEHICERIEMPLPDKQDIKKALCLEDNSINEQNYVNEFEFSSSFKLNFKENTNNLVDALNGMYLYDIKSLLKTIMSESKYGKISPFDYNYGFLTDRVKEGKKQIVKNSGLLEVIDIKEKNYHEHIADIDNLKVHLENEKTLIENYYFLQSNLPRPKGILLVGAPGCGKSESAKATASILGLPLYRLNIGDLLGHKYGQSENRFNEALRTADASAPCVLWIDEIEKAFAGAGNEQNNDDTLTHIIGRFLTWMQEHETLVYLVATANHLKQMRPELLRKGRWDDIYYLTYPSVIGRFEILKKSIQRYNLILLDDNNHILLDNNNHEIFSNEELSDTTKEKIKDLILSMDNWSGAEISSMVVELVKDIYRKNPNTIIDKIKLNDLISIVHSNSSSKKDKEIEEANKVKIEKEIRDMQINNLIVFDDKKKEEIEKLLKEKYENEKKESKQQYQYTRYDQEGYKPASKSVYENDIEKLFSHISKQNN